MGRIKPGLVMICSELIVVTDQGLKERLIKFALKSFTCENKLKLMSYWNVFDSLKDVVGVYDACRFKYIKSVSNLNKGQSKKYMYLPRFSSFVDVLAKIVNEVASSSKAGYFDSMSQDDTAKLKNQLHNKLGIHL